MSQDTETAPRIQLADHIVDDKVAAEALRAFDDAVREDPQLAYTTLTEAEQAIADSRPGRLAFDSDKFSPQKLTIITRTLGLLAATSNGANAMVDPETEDIFFEDPEVIKRFRAASQAGDKIGLLPQRRREASILIYRKYALALATGSSVVGQEVETVVPSPRKAQSQ